MQVMIVTLSAEWDDWAGTGPVPPTTRASIWQVRRQTSRRASGRSDLGERPLLSIFRREGAFRIPIPGAFPLEG
jgi:hypothetical protein